MAHRIKDRALRARVRQMTADGGGSTGLAAGETVRAVIVFGETGRRVRNCLLRIVCSQRWEDDVVERMNAEQLPLVEKTGPLRRVLHESEFYPPGGDDTGMLQCRICKRHLPPQVVGSIGACYECFQERQITCYLHGRPIDPDRLARLYARGKITTKEFQDALQPLERVVREAPRYLIGMKVAREDAIAVMGRAQQFKRSRGRAIYSAADPAVRGGAVDPDRDLIIEPWTDDARQECPPAPGEAA